MFHVSFKLKFIYLISIIVTCKAIKYDQLLNIKLPFINYDLVRMPLIDWKQLDSDPKAVKQPVHLHLGIFGNSYMVSLRRGQTMFTPDAVIVVHRNDGQEMQFNASDIKTEPVEGVVLGHPDSYVRGYIDDGIFNGVLSVDDEHYFMESADKYLDEANNSEAIVYRTIDIDNFPYDDTNQYKSRKKSDSAWKSVNKTFCKVIGQVAESKLKLIDEEKEDSGIFSEAIHIGNVCKMKVVGDHWFVHELNHNDMNKAIKTMEFHIKEADSMFRVTDFDGNNRPDDVRIRVVRAELFHNPKDRNYFLADPTYNATTYLDKFSYYNHDGLCGAMAFSYKRFPDDVLGYAYRGGPRNIGGICYRRRILQGREKSMNVGMVSLFGPSGKVPIAQSAVVVTHEIGHMFGSSHDEDNENGACFIPKEEKHFIMSSMANPGTSAANRKFSPCSVRMIYKNLKVNSGCLRCRGRECNAAPAVVAPQLFCKLIICLVCISVSQ